METTAKEPRRQALPRAMVLVDRVVGLWGV